MVAQFQMIALVLIALQALPFTYGAGCETGWFGSDCQYRCHCRDNSCDPDGQCLDGSPCERGWFGPSCQYADLAINSDVQLNKHKVAKLTDGNENTCLDGSTGKVTLRWKTDIQITWFRVYSSKPTTNNLDVQFGRPGYYTNCTNRRQANISDTAYEVHCDLNEPVTQIVLSGSDVKFLCSVYVSGGRNVALKQETAQSSNYSDTDWLSSNAVDGATDSITPENSCTYTADNDLTPNLDITFSREVAVNRYVLYNQLKTNNRVVEHLRRFILTSYSRDDQVQFQHTDKTNRDEKVVTVLTTTAIIAMTNIEATRENKYKQKYLNLCEIEIYGDSACAPGKYGLECGNTCNCAIKEEACFVSSGACPSGCADGFSGEDCNTPKDFNQEPPSEYPRTVLGH